MAGTAAASRIASPTPPPPEERLPYKRTRNSVLEEADGQLESVEQLAIAFQAGRRAPWALPGDIRRKAWAASVSISLLKRFLGSLVEGSSRPRWAKGGLIVLDSRTRTVIGSLEDRDFAAGNKLVPGDWANLLGCSARQARRCVRVAEELDLVEQIRNRLPHRRERCEVAAAYRPTEKLIAWVLERRPPAELALTPTEKMSDPQKITPSSDVGGDSSDVEDLHEAGQIDAPDQALRAGLEVAEVVELSPQAPPPPSSSTMAEAGEGDVRVPVGNAKPANVVPFAPRPPERPAGPIFDPATSPPAAGRPGPGWRAEGDPLGQLAALTARIASGEVSWGELPQFFGDAKASDEQRRAQAAEEARQRRAYEHIAASMRRRARGETDGAT